ncbi:hypothetical protein Tco_0997795 [Tanacetum coccineum]
MAPMALSDSKINNDKSCFKTCLKNYETLKKQYDDLIFKLHKTEFKAATYKRGLAIVEDQLVTFRKNEILFSKEIIVLKREEKLDQRIFITRKRILPMALSDSEATVEDQLVTFRKNEILFSEEIAVLKREVGCKIYEISVLKTEFEKVKQEKEGIEFKIEKFDSASKSLDKFDDEKKPKFKVEKKTGVFKTVSPTMSKIEFVRPKQQEKPVRKPVKYAEMSGPISLNTARQSHFNAVRTNWVNAVKASACWVWRPIKPNSASITLKRYDYVDVRGRSRYDYVDVDVRTNWVNAVKASACWVWRPIKPNSASITLKRYDYVDARGRSRLGYKAAVKLHDQFDDEKRAGAELTQQNDKSQYKK